ncbi:hypothetical protein Asulf_02272 [Archaeoglobus sulfaticallidus PM70-1]|uniref:Uncharacterized protein n=1 Tax=Archaeoglobus sulfaticallidus PM70-1 TaxID=387631 RepID=N0BEZ2_9EURY|nr:hypothetical protein [Archaeoglobus sulfaticallidus]AGK62224.1 hypothetical protein Asulf_02272 [Archaeoglobus sulfaticallidus PM70-1]
MSDLEGDVKLSIDGKEIPMNPYVQKVFLRVILALVSTLKGVDDNWSHLEISIDR